jgi:hypothetical protein
MAAITTFDPIPPPSARRCDLVLDGISHRYRDGLAVDDVSLDIGGGAF